MGTHTASLAQTETGSRIHPNVIREARTVTMKFRRSHFRLQALNKPGPSGGQDRRYRVLSVEEIQGMAAEDNLGYSLKVYAMAYAIAMKVYTGSPESIEAQALLQVCEDEVARGID